MLFIGAQVALAIAGCSTTTEPVANSSESSRAAHQAYPYAAASSSTPSSAKSVTRSPSPTAAPSPIAAKDLLLTESELINGQWADDDDTEPENLPDVESTSRECINQYSVLNSAPEQTSRAAAAWRRPATSEQVISRALVYSDAAAAERTFDAYQARVADCTTWTVNGAFQMNQTQFPVDLGDQAVGLQQSSQAPDGSVPPLGYDYTVTIRQGNVVISVSNSTRSLDLGGQIDTKTLAERSVAKAHR